ncbi:MAG: glycosyltransferase [Clostridia bacterium]|nr:glycosyltransferase [Clostridia bacterium]
MDDVKVSISCLTYNHEKYIRKCLDGLVSQKTNFKYEILIHDDASTDQTAAIIQEYEKKYPEIIKPIYQVENQYSKGVRIGRTYQYPRVRGEYIAFCEGDDYWCDENKLQKQFDAMQSDCSCTLCVHSVQKVTNCGELLDTYIKPSTLSYGIILGDQFLYNYLTGKESYPFQTSSYFIKKDILLNMPNFRYQFKVGDVPMLLWSAAKGNILYIEGVYSCYRIGVPGSYNAKLNDKKYVIKQIKANIDGYLAFNEDTNHKYWDFMKHKVLYSQIQYSFAIKEKISKEQKKEIKKELSIRELFTAKIKFTWLGNLLRKIRHRWIRRFS